MLLKTLSDQLGSHGLIPFGAFHAGEDGGVPVETGTLAIIGNAGSAIWPHVALRFCSINGSIRRGAGSRNVRKSTAGHGQPAQLHPIVLMNPST